MLSPGLAPMRTLCDLDRPYGNPTMIRHAVIRCAWDRDASVWYVQETDIPGLVTEAPTLDALRAKLPGMVRDLIDVDEEIAIDLIAYAHDRIRVEAA